MQSTSKVTVSTETLGAISTTYLKKELARSKELSQGWYNTIHILEFSDASKACLKISPPSGFQGMRYEKDLLDAELAVHQLLAEKGLKVPGIMAWSRGDDFIGHPWFVYEYLEGEQLGSARGGMEAPALARAEREVARQTARVHGIVGTRFGRWNQDHTAGSSWLESFSAMFFDLLADAQDKQVELPFSRADLEKVLAAAGPALDLVTEPRLVLWDLHDGNVIVDPSSGALVGFLDPDRAVWGDPLFDFYFRTLASAGENWKGEYRKACSDHSMADVLESPGAPERLALYDLYLDLVMVIEVYFRGFGKEHEAWTRANLARSWELCCALA